MQFPIAPPGLAFALHIYFVFSLWHFLIFSHSFFLMVLSAQIDASIKAAPSCSWSTTDRVRLISQDNIAAPHVGRFEFSAAGPLLLLLFPHRSQKSVDWLPIFITAEQILMAAASELNRSFVPELPHHILSLEI